MDQPERGKAGVWRLFLAEQTAKGRSFGIVIAPKAVQLTASCALAQPRIGDVITSYSIHYTKLYDGQAIGRTGSRGPIIISVACNRPCSCGWARITSYNVCYTKLLRVKRQFTPLWGRGMTMIFQNPQSALNPFWRVGRLVGEAVRLREPGLSREQVHRITSYNVCYTKLLRSLNPPSNKKTSNSNTSAKLPLVPCMAISTTLEKPSHPCC